MGGASSSSGNFGELIGIGGNQEPTERTTDALLNFRPNDLFPTHSCHFHSLQ